MNPLIACCGLDCEACDARIATITNNDALREKTAALWTKLNAVTITPDMIRCTGCRVEGPKTPFCDKLCPVHNCVREKKLDTCADCAQREGCPTLGRIAAKHHQEEKAAEEAGIPYMHITTDYAGEDAGQLQTRIEAFLETI